MTTPERAPVVSAETLLSSEEQSASRHLTVDDVWTLFTRLKQTAHGTDPVAVYVGSPNGDAQPRFSPVVVLGVVIRQGDEHSPQVWLSDTADVI